MSTVYANVLLGVLFWSTNRCLNSAEFSGGECNRVRIFQHRLISCCTGALVWFV